MNAAIPCDHLTITAHGHWVADEIPPRCRKPRPVRHETSARTSVPIVATEQAPAAFRVLAYARDDQDQIIRLYRDRLYTRHIDHRGEPYEFPTELEADRYYWFRADSPVTFQAVLDTYARRFLIIRSEEGDEVWETTGEPRYCVTTLGTSHNRDGTALMTETGDHPGRRADSYFRADDYEGARTHAEAVALERGDTESAPRFRNLIEVLIPEAVTLQTVPPTPREVEELRWDYRSATSRLSDYADSAGHEGPAFAEVARLRQAIIDTGYPVAPDDCRPVEPRELERAYNGT